MKKQIVLSVYLFSLSLYLFTFTNLSNCLVLFKTSKKSFSNLAKHKQNEVHNFRHYSFRNHLLPEKNIFASRLFAKKKIYSDDFEQVKIDIRKVEDDIDDCQKQIVIASANVLNCSDIKLQDYWIQKEADLRKEKADLRQNKAFLIQKEAVLTKGLVYDLDRNGQELWESIVNSTLSDDKSFLIFPKMINYLDRFESYKSIFIRNDYLELFDIMSERLVIPSSLLPFKRRFVITGTPGIGKSTFLIYFIWRILKGNSSNDQIWKNKKIFLQLSPSKILHFQGNRTVVYKDEYIASSNMDSDTILIVDMLVQNEPIYCPGIVIILSSPNPSRFKEFLKLPHCLLLYMNVWKKEEIMKVWKDSYKDRLTKEEVNSAFEKIGGNVRYVLEKNDEVDKRLNSALSQYQNDFRSLKQAVGSSGAKDSEISYTLLNYFPTDRNHDIATIEYASIYIASEIILRINKNDFDDAIRLLNINQCGGLQGFIGVVFEIFVHKYFYEYGLENIQRLMPKKNLNSNEKSNFTLYGVPTSFSIDNITVVNEFPITFSLSKNNANINIDENTYYRPSISNFPSTDSFIINGNNVFIFQVTVGLTHPVKEKGLNMIVKLLKEKFPDRVFNYHLVFICPKGKSNTINFTHQKVKKSEKVSVSFNNMDKLGNDSKPFICNQWLAEFDISDRSVIKVLNLIREK